ncbi:hypothetical protein BGZ57DRAFT_946213 [Hyaloscypha finlandica]|nr:hypothetical protein BGZ57DRAFT_946213 [Hyaloscypha finlandica]
MSTPVAATWTYTSVWINWSYGTIRGATLTLSKRYGGFLTAFLAIYIGFAGRMFWKTLSYALYQHNTTRPGTTRDALSACLSLAWLPLSWRGRTNRPFIRILPFAFLAALNVGFFGIVSIFSSVASSAPGNSTLILGPRCGGYNNTSFSFSLGRNYLSKILADTYNAATYVRQCYSANATDLGCGVYHRQSLPFTVNPNATCPFASGLCLFNDNSAFAMDTGLLDSHADLGINAPPQHRVLFRRVTTCAPIHAAQWATQVNESGFGPVWYINAGPNPPSNYTFSYVISTGSDGFGYALSAVNAFAGYTPNTSWVPDALINRTDADITLMILNQNTMAHEPVDDQNSSYIGDSDLRLLACAEQYQICNPNAVTGPAGCTLLTRELPLLWELSSNTVSLNFYQEYTVIRIQEHISWMNIFHAVSGRGAAALNANEHTYRLIQSAIPSTQWHIEVSLWFSLCLAKLQAHMIEWATAPTNIEPTSQSNTNTAAISPALVAPYQTIMCRNQLIHSTTSSYQSFSILGLSLIIAVGGVIIIIGLFVDVV